jgi:hypothetical protein
MVNLRFRATKKTPGTDPEASMPPPVGYCADPTMGIVSVVTVCFTK